MYYMSMSVAIIVNAILIRAYCVPKQAPFQEVSFLAIGVVPFRLRITVQRLIYETSTEHRYLSMHGDTVGGGADNVHCVN